MSEAFVEKGILKGHTDWVTAISTTNENPSMVLSASRDKSLLVWALNQVRSTHRRSVARTKKTQRKTKDDIHCRRATGRSTGTRGGR